MAMSLKAEEPAHGCHCSSGLLVHMRTVIATAKAWFQLESTLHLAIVIFGCRDGAVVRALNSQIRRHMWIEFVGSLLCTERFSPGTPVFPLLKNQNLT